MPTTRSTREVEASVETVWATVADVYSQPRWWPRVSRVEGVGPLGFTQVMQTKNGRPVRADYKFATREPLKSLAWEQVLADSPFEHVLRSSRITIRLEPRGEGTLVTLEARQKLRGLSRFGGFMVRRATGAILDEALEGLASLHP